METELAGLVISIFIWFSCIEGGGSLLKLAVEPTEVIALHTEIVVYISNSSNITHNADLILPNTSISLVHVASNTEHYRLPCPSALPPGSSVPLPCGALPHGGQFQARLLSPRDAVLAVSPAFRVRWPPLLVRLPSRAESQSAAVACHIRLTTSLCPPERRQHQSSLPAITAVLQLTRPSASCSLPLALTASSSSYPLPDVLARPRDLRLPCDRLERPGLYRVLLVSNVSDSRLVACSNPINVTLSRRARLRVRGARGGSSVFPCDGGGVHVYYTRPPCAGPRDTVRVHAVLRAPVASATPPVTRRYIAERRLSSASSVVTFQCDLFREKYIRYCFSYVSVGHSRATHVLKTRCLRTRSSPAGRDGGFSSWSPWSVCGAACGPSSRVRYRVCNSPPPTNSGRFCQGSIVESESCLLKPCPTAATTHSPVAIGGATVDQACRCGCQQHVTHTRTYTVAADGHECGAGLTTWMFETDAGSVLRVTFPYLQLSAAALRVRNGWSISHELIADFSGVSAHNASWAPAVHQLLSHGRRLALEYVAPPSIDGDTHVGFVALVVAEASVSASARREVRSPPFTVLQPSRMVALLFIMSMLVVIAGMFVYHVYKSSRRHQNRTPSCESLLNATYNPSVSASTSATSVAPSIVRLQLRAPRRQRLSRASSCSGRLLTAADPGSYWTPPAVAESLPSSPATERHSCRRSGVSDYCQMELLPLVEVKVSESSRRLADTHTPDGAGRADSAGTLCAEQLPAGSLSALSAASALGLELDYYDYDVVNAGLAPGSHFGRDAPMQMRCYRCDVTAGCCCSCDVTPTNADDVLLTRRLFTPHSEDVTTSCTELTAEMTFMDDTDEDDGSLREEV